MLAALTDILNHNLLRLTDILLALPLHNYGFLDGTNKSLFPYTTIVFCEYSFCLDVVA